MSDSPKPSSSHLLLLPSYNTGSKVMETVKEALEYWAPVWVVVDGSNDGSGEELETLAKTEANLRVFRLAKNQGKGAAVLHGFDEAEAQGFTHILCMDADGQHPADMIPEYMTLSMAMPERMILGKPIFDDTAPRIRVNGRKLSNFWVHIETLSYEIGDSLFGMRVYPVSDLVRIMEQTRWARRYDFDAEIAVRLSWRGVRSVNVPTPVKYLTSDQGGVSHFKYGRDNVLITWMHFRLLVFHWWIKAPKLIIRRLRLKKKDQLENPDSNTSLTLLRRRISKLYRLKWHQHYVNNKLRTDPVYDAVYDALQDSSKLPLLDIGCGIGLLEFYLRERKINTAIIAIDQDSGKIVTAQKIAVSHYKNIRFEVSDTEFPEFQGNVTLLDVLQYNNTQNQADLLCQAAGAVAPSGLLVIRSGLSDSTCRSKLSKLTDRLGCLISWIKTPVHKFPTKEFVDEILLGEGLHGESRPLWGNTPFNNYLMIYRRPHTKDSGAGTIHR